MARTGLYKSEVKKARDYLVAQGVNPSVDAVRVALGHTGSKTTIHKYLKELDEDGNSIDQRKVSISDALQDFVARLAAQLQGEASQQVNEIQAKYAQIETRYEQEISALKIGIGDLRTQLQHVQSEALQEKNTREFTSEELHRETMTRRTLEQQVIDLKERLEENEQHRQSLEEKHQHARDALEHYRASIKEQRDQDQRRHEQQIQQLQAEMRQLQQSLIIKQDEVTRLNQDGVRLVAELSHAQKNLYDQQTHSRQVEQKLDELKRVEQQVNLLEARLSDKEEQNKTLHDQLDVTIARESALKDRAHALELEVTAANAKVIAQQDMVTELRAYLHLDKKAD